MIIVNLYICFCYLYAFYLLMHVNKSFLFKIYGFVCAPLFLTVMFALSLAAFLLGQSKLAKDFLPLKRNNDNYFVK